MSHTLFDIEGKLVILTGAAGMLGHQWRDSLVAAGAQVLPVDRAWPGLSTDVTDPESLRMTAAYYDDITRSAFGGGMFGPPKIPDALICAAAIDAKPGTPGCGPFEATPIEDWRRAIDVNLTGVMLTCQVFGSAMAKAGNGTIILISSMYGLVGPDNRRYQGLGGREPFFKPAVYSASKAALEGLCKYLACYWGPRGVRVNCIAFGAMGQADHHPKFRRRMDAAIPLGRMARSHEWDGPIQFLVSDASSYITGTTLVVDGGYTAW